MGLSAKRNPPFGSAAPSRSCQKESTFLASEDHATVMQGVLVDEGAVSGKTGVIPIIDVIALDLIAPSIGAPASAAGFVVATVREKLMANVAIVSHPHANVDMLRHFLPHRLLFGFAARHLA